MKPYTKTYMKYFGYDTSDFIPCEVCGKNASDIHHLEPRSIAKAKENLIDNLMALCRSCHDECGSSRRMNDTAKLIHRKKLLQVKTDHETERFI
jgi:5-methylcytosine-specific restriction endonuclease McrA